jgi:hypothetical protein
LAFAKANARTASVFLDELDPSGLKGSPDIFSSLHATPEQTIGSF